MSTAKPAAVLTEPTFGSVNTQLSPICLDGTCCPTDHPVVLGTEEDDTIHGGPKSQCIVGLGGNDELFAGFGGDRLICGSGEDRCNGNSGDDQIYGGEGDDTIKGGFGDDIIAGHAGDDKVLGGPGDDALSGGAGADVIEGGIGNDEIDGGDGENVLIRRLWRRLDHWRARWRYD